MLEPLTRTGGYSVPIQRIYVSSDVSNRTLLVTQFGVEDKDCQPITGHTFLPAANLDAVRPPRKLQGPLWLEFWLRWGFHDQDELRLRSLRVSAQGGEWMLVQNPAFLDRWIPADYFSAQDDFLKCWERALKHREANATGA